MRSRSLLFDVYGDYAIHHGGELGVQALAALTARFGVTEDSTRVTLSRMRREGWLTSRRVGRVSAYGLSDRGRRLIRSGHPRIFERGQAPWDGGWQLVIYQVPESERAVRERLRKALDWVGFGTLAPSTWVSPHDRLGDLTATLADRGIDVPLDTFTARTGSLEADRALALRCWDLATVAAGYQAFLVRWRARLAELRGPGLDDATAFVERVELLHEYRKFPFADPDLPPELLPEGWPGTAAHALFLEAYQALAEPAFRHFHAVVAGHPAPPPG